MATNLETGFGYIDDSDVRRVFRELPGNVRSSIYKAAARKVLRTHAQPVVRGLFLQASSGGANGNYPSLDYVARNIKTRNSKSKGAPGAVLAFNKDVPIGDRNWHAVGYQTLVIEGSYTSKGKPRKHRGTGKETGSVEGIFRGVSPYTIAFKRKRGAMLKDYKKSLSMEIQRALKRLRRRLSI